MVSIKATYSLAGAVAF